MATFNQIISESGNIANTSFPFQYVNIGGYTTFNGPNTLVLHGDEFPYVEENDGRFHAIVKANKEVRLRLHSNQLGFFSDQLSNYAKSAFNIDTSAPLLTNPFGTNGSSMDITLRGGSMIAAAVGDKGDRGVWDSANSPFHLETEQRDITQPNDRWRDSSLLLSLTAPYGDYTTLETYTLIYNQHDNDMWITILDISDAPDNGFVEMTEWETINPEYVDSESDAGRYGWDNDMWQFLNVFESGQDKDGRQWIVEVGLRISNDKWYLVVDGAIDSTGFDTIHEVQTAARTKVNALKQRKGEDPASGVGLLLGGGILMVVLLIVAVYAFAGSKAKGD